MSATGRFEQSAAEEDVELTEREIHDVLRNDRRRQVLERLRERGGSETVAELAEYIAALEAGTSPPPRNVRQSVYVSLHQTHLPKLDELDIVAYDPNEKTVVLTDGAAKVVPYMNGSPTPDVSWAQFYAAVGAVGLLALVGVAVGLPLLRGHGALVGGATLLVVTAAAVYQLLTGSTSPSDLL